MQKESAKSSALWQQLQELQQQLSQRDAAAERLQAEVDTLTKANQVHHAVCLSAYHVMFSRHLAPLRWDWVGLCIENLAKMD